MSDAEAFAEEVQRYADEFYKFCQSRHEMGAEKYGPVNFVTVDTLQMAMEEIADLANYALYTYIKLRLLQSSIEPPKEDEAPQVPGIAGWRNT